MRHRRIANRAENARLAPHRLVAVRTLVRRRPAQHERTAAALEAEQDVLRPTAEQHGVFDRAARQTLRVHPLGHVP
jgi:hypothetical protein